jgi:glycopeptide antibiotics resistance protein
MKHNNIRISAKVIGFILLVAYFLILSYVVFFATEFGRDDNHVFQYNLVPLKTIYNFIRYHQSVTVNALMANILGNVVAFMPLGFIVPIVFKRKETYYYFHIVVLWAFIVSLFIEVGQIVMSVGSFDVDDLILNTLGAMIGYWLYLYIRKLYRQLHIRRSRIDKIKADIAKANKMQATKKKADITKANKMQATKKKAAKTKATNAKANKKQTIKK